MPPSSGRSCRGPPAGALKLSTQCQREESRRGGMFIRPKALSHFAFSCLVVKLRVTSGSACATLHISELGTCDAHWHASELPVTLSKVQPQTSEGPAPRQPAGARASSHTAY